MATATVASDLAKLLSDGETTIIKGWLQALQRAGDARISTQEVESQARDLLRLQAAKQPTETSLAAGLADLARRDGKPREGLRLLREARAWKGAVDGVDWRLAQIRCAQAADSPENGARALEEAGRGLERLPADAQRRVFQALVAALRQRLGDDGLIPHQDRVDVRRVEGERRRAAHHLLGPEVASHHIERDADRPRHRWT